MITALFIICLFLVIAIVVALVAKRSTVYNDFDDEIVTHHTTVTTTTNNDVVTNVGLNVNGIPVVGILERQWDGSTPFVIDPVDKDKMFLNTKDDLYEDGAGKIWGLK